MKIISGGQTGADRAGLEIARRFGYSTGGWMPRGFSAEDGPQPHFADLYAMQATDSDDPAVRTGLNARDADITVWFGDGQSGGRTTTEQAAQGKPYIEILLPGPAPTPAETAEKLRGAGVVNIAGHRESVQPGIEALTRDYLSAVFGCLQSTASIRHWLFDLDDTLYSASSDFFAQVSERITVCMAAYLKIDHDQARVLRKRYWQEYGTSLRGMIIHHGMDPEPFLAYVHNVEVEHILQPDAQVRAMLLRCAPGVRHVFTNSPSEYAWRVLKALGIDDLFDNIFDIRHSQFLPKPHRTAYERVLEALHCEGRDCIMIDDAPQNLVTARSLGIRSVWLNSLTSEAGMAMAAGVNLIGDNTGAHHVIHRLLDLEAVLAAGPVY